MSHCHDFNADCARIVLRVIKNVANCHSTTTVLNKTKTDMNLHDLSRPTKTLPDLSQDYPMLLSVTMTITIMVNRGQNHDSVRVFNVNVAFLFSLSIY